MRRFVLLAPALLIASCGDEPTVAERFNEIQAEVENKARDYEAGAENMVAEQERRLAEEANALLSQNANLFGNEVDIDVDTGPADLNAR